MESNAPFIAVGILWLFILLVGVAAFAVWIWALVDCLRRDFPDTTLKVVWALVIIFLHFIGAIVYLAVGRQQGRLYT